MGASQSKSDYIVATDAKTAVFVPRTNIVWYEDLVDLLPRHFPNIDPKSIVVQTDELDICRGRDVDIPPDLWEEISPQIQNIKVVSRPTQRLKKAPRLMTLYLETRNEEIITVSLPCSASVTELTDIIQDSAGIPSDKQFLVYNHQLLDSNFLLSEYNIYNGATISLWDSDPLLGLKPVVYVFSPLPTDALIRLSLSKAWSFSVIYPDAPITDSEFGQSITWNVKTNEDHTLTDMRTGTRVSYLFWETKTNPGLPPSPPASPQISPHTVRPFDPLCPQVTNDNSVVLHASKAAVYLDKALHALGLHIEARTSFITFWLPFILKHNYVAVNFLPQASYDKAAPLDVKPKPDIVIRVFMLFKRVCEDELDEWEGALSRASEDTEFWKDIVGADTKGMKDEKLFRVLEWGGMEVNY
ncbi:hypothetical protein IW261DRAFT_1513918 [Armillaria novae-zelandiae]|uniref:Ubiquitin-like domain-containing protein n=1 Tax=Armillaria novae-zelandiae TaxID=153914 RepID=A0AA39NSE2_9AGAR|nr:hypothetical protein IW261DRAFT_1513918 [Armillaria novae-zelandiae]